MVGKNKNRGMSLIGSLVALAIVAVALGSAIALMSRNVRLSSIARNEITATGLAEEGIELVKNIRDSGDNYDIPRNIFPLDGFDRVLFLSNYGGGIIATDNRIDTYNSTNSAGNPLLSANQSKWLNWINRTFVSSQPLFRNNTAGLCLDTGSTVRYYTCALTSGRKFIRRIQLINNPSSSLYACKSTVAGGRGGITVISTVFWVEDWESQSWPTSYNDSRLTNSSNTDLHKVQVVGCLYDWRQE